MFPLCLFYEQQSLGANEATEEMEISILKTCHCVNELRQEVSHYLTLNQLQSQLKSSGVFLFDAQVINYNLSL